MRWQEIAGYCMLGLVCFSASFYVARMESKVDEAMKAGPQKALSEGVSMPYPIQQPSNAFFTAENRKDEGGVSVAQHYSIQWGPDKAAPIEVLQATLARMEHVQQTMNASDTNARALFHVMKAVEILEGQEIAEIIQSANKEVQ